MSGPYTATWKATAIGDTEDGFRLRYSFSKKLITADPWGDSVIDAVYRGGNFFLSFVAMEYSQLFAEISTTNQAIAWPYQDFGLHGQAGRLDSGSSLNQALVLTAVAGTTAAAAPATLTANETILSESAQVDLAFASRDRTVPLEFRLYPYNSTDDKWFAIT